MSNGILAFQMNPEGDRKDVVHIIREGEGLGNSIKVHNLWGNLPSNIDNVKAAVVSGSSLTLSEPMSDNMRQKSEIVAYNALYLANKGVPVLAICYGAQVIANELWPNSVVPTGTWNIGETLLVPTGNDSIFGNNVNPHKIRVSYKDNLVGIPPENIIALDMNGSIIAFRYGSLVGILGHPEMPIEIAEKVISERSSDPRYSKVNVLKLPDGDPISDAKEILYNFFGNIEP